jgi:hypothetical protein
MTVSLLGVKVITTTAGPIKSSSLIDVPFKDGRDMPVTLFIHPPTPD